MADLIETIHSTALSRVLFDEPVQGLSDFMESLRRFFDLSHTFDVLCGGLFDAAHGLGDLVHAHQLFLVREGNLYHCM